MAGAAPSQRAAPGKAMQSPATTSRAIDDEFFERLPPLPDARETFERVKYQPAPDDWHLIATDIENSTGAIAAGQHKRVNFVAACAIAALKNLCAPLAIPFLFGGDGSIAMVPGSRADESRQILARLRGLSAREFGLVLRVGQVRVADVRRLGADVLVGRYEPSPGNSFGVFLGGGVNLIEQALKRRDNPELADLLTVPPELDDGAAVDLSGLSCRWDELRSVRGKMVTLIIHGAADPGDVYASVMQLVGDGDPSPARVENLAAHWPPQGFLLEARALRGRWPLPLMALWVLAKTALVGLLLVRRGPIGRFDPQRYLSEVASNTDFCKHDTTLSFVIDCPEDRIQAIRRTLEERAARGELRYGMHLSSTALMTCIVTSALSNKHVHFIDGGDGGYTNAAKDLKGPATSVA
jgi:hypothetical protein